MTNVRSRLLPLAFLGGVIVVWQAAVLYSGQRTLYPYPTGVVEAAARTVEDGSLLRPLRGACSASCSVSPSVRCAEFRSAC